MSFVRFFAALGLTLCSSFLAVSLAQEAASEAPFPGTKGTWNGFVKYDFEVKGKLATVVVPPQVAPGKPWVWHGEFFGHKPAPDIALLKHGFHAVYLRVPDMLGSPEAVGHWNELYAELTGKYGFAPKPALVGLSRGGLYCYNWAAANPEKVACIYGDAPVCDFKSWPGGQGVGRGSPRDWKLVLSRYGFKDDDEANAYTKNPVDNLKPLADAKVPLLHVYGDADDIVPWEENTGVIANRYPKLGGEIVLIPKKGVGHHPHGLDDSTPIVEFIARHAAGVKKTAAVRGDYYKVSYAASSDPAKLQFGVTYVVWVPRSEKPLRGVIVHQHGCGDGACRGGATAAYDWHWQELAEKWNCALAGPSYHQPDQANCRLWCDPRNGSNETYLRSLDDFAIAANRAELNRVPWCLWGHSGGGFWASLMQTLHPERIVAIWGRSGSAFNAWEKGEIPKPEIPEAAYKIPVMLNPGAKENGDMRFRNAWDGSLAMFQAYRAHGAPIAVSPDPRTSHECGDSRYLAIPFFDTCLALRLPEEANPTAPLKPLDLAQGRLAKLLSDTAAAPDQYGEKPEEAMWIPGEAFASKWSEYVKTGAVSDTTPPAAPFNLTAKRNESGEIELTWEARADFESGLTSFRIERDQSPLIQLPEKPIGKFGRALMQSMSYHDTPENLTAEMRAIDRSAEKEKPYKYRVIAVNSAGLASEPSAEIEVK